jgi:hypothetical protein
MRRLARPSAATGTVIGRLRQFLPATISRATTARRAIGKARSAAIASQEGSITETRHAMRPSSQRPASSASGMPLTGSRLVQLGMAVSRNPAIAVGVSRTIADVVFQGASLNAVTETLAVARRSGVLVRQNIALAILYNTLALPVAMAGWVTPLLAALAMSSSSVLVIANAFRVGRSR